MDEQDNIGTFFMWGFCHPAGVDFRWATFPVVALRLLPANGFEAAGFIQPRGRFLFLTSGASRGRCPRLRRSRLQATAHTTASNVASPGYPISPRWCIHALVFLHFQFGHSLFDIRHSH